MAVPEPSSDGEHPAAATWGVLVYLAGDTPWGHVELRDDLHEILASGGSRDLTLVVQHDGPEGGSRYIVPPRSSPKLEAVELLPRADSGKTTVLLDFVRWGLTICRAERIALVIGSSYSVAPNSGEEHQGASVLSLTFDQGSGNFLDVVDLAGVLQEALTQAERAHLDLLVIDSCFVQFLELAYELEGTVRFVIAPQTTIPAAGIDYRRVLARWKELAGAERFTGTADVSRELLKVVNESYERSNEPRAVSLLDLERLDEVARAFDTLCIGTMQVLGEGLIWRARNQLLEHLEKTAQGPVYDCGSFFALWSATLDAFADEAYQGWLGSTLMKPSDSRLTRFFEATARHLENTSVEAVIRDVAKELELPGYSSSLPAEAGAQPVDIKGLEASVRTRLTPLTSALLNRGDRRRASTRVLKFLDQGLVERIRLLAHGKDKHERQVARVAAVARDRVVKVAMDSARRLLPDERQFDLLRLEEAAESAGRLARQSDQARRALLGDAETRGMVLEVGRSSDGSGGWPRWSGVSIYLPTKLDELMNDSYQRFAFHQRVHWAALLGAANLIKDHPRALWRLVSSLLATGAAGTRRDVLRRLTGPDSVVWGLRGQFQVMAPAPTLTLSLERRNQTSTSGSPEESSERYLLRLESIARGAVVTEQDSRVQRDVMNRALNELNGLLQRDVMTTRTLADLRAIGGLLGEDIFQALGRTLEDERQSVQNELPDAIPHLQLQIPRELMKYPWELLHHHGEWLGERYAMGRQVFMETGLARRVPARRLGRIRALVIGDPKFDSQVQYRQLPGARAEAEQVAEWFEHASREVGSVVEFDRCRDTRIHTRLTSAELRALLREGHYDIVHFAGHGVFRAELPETSAWVLSDGELWSLEIRNTLTEHPAPPWLVFANACQAGMDGGGPERKYHENVFGLATAFINQGVAAYIAPLWPIDDLLAQHIALQFYENLLSRRTTLGEALRRAKTSARTLAYDGANVNVERQDVLWAGLGWASLVLYGDPTEELFQALAGGSHRFAVGRRGEIVRADTTTVDRRRANDASIKAIAGSRVPLLPITAANVMHAPDFVVSRWVQGPNWQDAGNFRSGSSSPPPDGSITLELIDDGVLRRWRVAQRPSATTRGAETGSDGLPGSCVAALLADERVREVLPSKRGIARVIGRWVLSGFNDGTRGLVREYDREQVKTEGLLMASGTSAASFVPARRNGNGATANAAAKRALLLVHGTFSKTAAPVEGFGPDFIASAKQHYDVVLGFDHWTLSKTPEANAQMLADELRAFDADLLQDARLDIVSHSRGGLVARAFCELLDHSAAVRNVVFIGTPNGGTDLANPRNWASFADLLVNMTGVEGAEYFGRLAGLLAQLAVTDLVNDIPGLLAQSPESALDPTSLLGRLQSATVDRKTLRYSVISSEFEPTALVPNLKKLAKAAVSTSLNASVDALFGTANDLVVNTANVWRIAQPEGELKALPAFLDGRALVYTPPKPTFTAPEGALVETALGVHHCNLFAQPLVRKTIKGWLGIP
ncbi:MAG: CHAT domain-containing protein [Vicinamibacterales bacterium]